MQDREPLRYWVDLDGRSFEVREIDGVEAVSRPFRFEVRFVIADGLPLDPDAVVKTSATIRMIRGAAHVRSLEGVVTDVAVGLVIRGAPEVRLVLEHRLALARWRTDLRVFRDRTVPEMVTEVLSAIGVVPERRLREQYERRPYCVQLRETDLDYVHRLLEDEGIHYFFLESGVMVLGDSPAAYDRIAGDPALLFRAGLGMDQDEDAVWSVGDRAELSVGQVSLRDFNPEHPSLDMDVGAPGPTSGGPEFYDYPGEYLEPAAGRRKAQLTAESFACAAAKLQGRSFCGRLLPGHTYELLDPPEGVPSGAQVILSITHAFRRLGSGFSCDFEALPASITYRPPRVTAVPRLLNPLTGFVTGAGGDDVHTDEQGRVKVHFHWDRRLPRDNECSYWVPVVQDNTGHSVGIPRVGWEVLVHFLEGDPDRPVVLGRVYNAEDTFPVPLPEGKTKSSLKSMCSPGRDGMNEIQFEDYAHREHIMVYAERDQNIVVAHDRREEIGRNELAGVYRDETIAVGRDHTEDLGASQSVIVERNQTVSVAADSTRTVAESDMTNVEGNRTLSIGGMHLRLINTDDAVVAKNLVETVGGVDLEASVKTNGTEVGEGATLMVGGAIVEVAKDEKSEASGKGRTETVGAVVFTQAGEDIKVRSDSVRVLAVGGAVVVTAAKDAVLTGATTLRAKADSIRLQMTSDGMLKVGDTTVTMKDDLIQVKAKNAISLSIAGPNQQAAGKSTQV